MKRKRKKWMDATIVATTTAAEKVRKAKPKEYHFTLFIVYIIKVWHFKCLFIKL